MDSSDPSENCPPVLITINVGSKSRNLCCQPDPRSRSVLRNVARTSERVLPHIPPLRGSPTLKLPSPKSPNCHLLISRIVKMPSVISEAHEVLCLDAPGSPFEMRPQRCFEGTLTPRTANCYVHAPSSYREIWLAVAAAFATEETDREYLVFFGNSGSSNDGDPAKAPRRSISYVEANRMIYALANILYDHYGARKGTRVGIAARNSIEFVLIWCG